MTITTPPPAEITPRMVIESLSNHPTQKIFFHSTINNTPGCITFLELQTYVKQLVAQFRIMGLSAGDCVAIHGETSFGWLLADLALADLGCVSLSLFPSAPHSRIVQSLKKLNCRFLITDDATLAKTIGDGVWFLGKTVSEHLSIEQLALDPSATDILTPDHQSARPLVTFEKKLAPQWQSIFTIVSTSGTLSEPKFFGVALTPLMETMSHFCDIYNLTLKDRMLLFLPLSHLPQRMIAYGCLLKGIELILSTTQQFVADSLRLNPTATVVVPRVLESLYERLKRQTSPEFRSAFIQAKENNIADSTRYDDALAQMPRTNINLASDCFGPSIKTIFVGSAPMPSALMRTLTHFNFPIYEVYGTTELGILAMTQPNRCRVGYAGETIPWGKAKINESGEICLATPTPFLAGYINDSGFTPATWQLDTFHSTGDIGTLDNGYIKVIDRIKDFCVLSSGKKVHVGALERKFKTALPQCEFVIIGNGEKRLKLLIFTNNSTQNTAERKQNPCMLVEQINSMLITHNGTAPSLECIHAYAIWYQLPRIEDGCMTETLKLRRHHIEVFYKPKATWHNPINKNSAGKSTEHYTAQLLKATQVPQLTPQ